MSTVHPSTRRTLLPALTVATALGLAACGGPDSSSGAGSTPTGAVSTPTATVTQTVTPSPSPSAGRTTSSSSSPATSPTHTPAPTSASSSAPAVPRCTAADVSVTVGPGDGAAGTTYYPLIMTNTSSSACRSGGYGGVSLVGDHGNQIGAAAVRQSTTDARVVPFVLIPNAHATATLGVADALNYSKATCRPTQASGLRVYVPNETRAKFVPLKAQACRATSVTLLHLQPYQPVS